MCFTHTFAGSTHKLVLLGIYPAVQQDSESGIWCVPTDCDEKVVLQVTSLSSPLVVDKMKETFGFQMHTNFYNYCMYTKWLCVLCFT